MKYIDVVFDRMPDAPGGECCFVETEDENGHGVGSNRGIEWVKRDDGFTVLRIPVGGR